MQRIGIGKAGLKRFVFDGNFERCRKLLEGRYLLVKVGPDESCAVITDRFGQLDLYVQEGAGQAVLATDLSLLPIAQQRRVEYDQAALAHTLCVYGYRPPKQHTLYQGVRRVGIDQWVHIQDGKLEIREEAFQPIATRLYGERELNQYADILLDAVEVRGSRNGNVVYLSSGWDSTAILACLVKLFGARKVRAVIGRMLYSRRSGVINQFEIDRARAFANYFGVRLDVVDHDYRSTGPELVERHRPFLRSHQLQSLTAVGTAALAGFVARTARTNETVFAGEISDGAHNLGFSQFATIFHPVLEFREYSDKMASYCFGPTFLNLFQRGEGLTDPVYRLLRSRCGEDIFDEPAKKALACRKQLLASFFLRAKRLPLWSLGNSKLLTEMGREAYSRELERVYLSRVADELTAETLYSWYLHVYNCFHWQSSTTGAMAKTLQAHGLRLALPFWDSRLQHFLSAMPESWGRGLDLNPTKHPLKWTLKHRLDYPFHLQVGPHSYLYDVDPSFSHTAEIVYGSAFAPYFKTLLKKRSYHQVLSPEIFDLEYLDAVVARYRAGTEVRGAEMDDLFALCLLSMVGWYGGSTAGRALGRSTVGATA